MSKFDSELAEHLYNISLNDFHDGVMGDIEWNGHFTKFYEAPGSVEAPGAYILYEDDQGFVGVQTFADNMDLDEAWSDLEREYVAWVDAQTEDGYSLV